MSLCIDYITIFHNRFYNAMHQISFKNFHSISFLIYVGGAVNHHHCFDFVFVMAVVLDGTSPE